jgi:hypothetical protein
MKHLSYCVEEVGVRNVWINAEDLLCHPAGTGTQDSSAGRGAANGLPVGEDHVRHRRKVVKTMREYSFIHVARACVFAHAFRHVAPDLAKVRWELTLTRLRRFGQRPVYSKATRQQPIVGSEPTLCSLKYVGQRLFEGRSFAPALVSTPVGLRGAGQVVAPHAVEELIAMIIEPPPQLRGDHPIKRCPHRGARGPIDGIGLIPWLLDANLAGVRDGDCERDRTGGSLEQPLVTSTDQEQVTVERRGCWDAEPLQLTSVALLGGL